MNAKPHRRLTRSRLEALWHFVSVEIWDVELSSLTLRRRFGVNALRVLQLMWRGFREDECPLHASALTFSTMMSIVPVLALSLALARGLGGDTAAQDWIRSRIAEWTRSFETSSALVVSSVRPESERPGAPAATLPVTPVDGPPAAVVDADSPGAMVAPVVVRDEDEIDAEVLAQRINALVEKGFERMQKVSFGALGGVGLVLLVWMVIAVLGQVEASFNRVWGVKVERALWRKFTDYLSVLFILPLMLLAATSMPIMDLATRFLDPTGAQIIREVLGSGVLKHVTVFVMTTLVFTFLIMFMPNTRVRLVPGLTGGVITTLLFLLWLWVCAALQVGAARAGKLYGSFATLPILLAWVNVSWQIVFLGAESAFAVQNCATYHMEQNSPLASMRERLVLALALVTEAARRMVAGGAFETNAYAREKRIPVRLLRSTIDELVKVDLLAKVADAPGRYVLLRSPESLSVREVLESLTSSGVDPVSIGMQNIPAPVVNIVKRLTQDGDSKALKMSIRDLAASIPSGPAVA